MIDCQRHRFSIPDSVHYLNCAYMSPLLTSVQEAGIAGVRRKARPWEILGDDFYTPSEELRAMAAKLVNASADAVALIPAASYGAAIAGAAVPLRRGQNVVMPAEEFPSVVYVWRERCRRSGAEVRTVPRPEDSAFPSRRWTERLLDAIDENTAAVALTIVHWTDGTAFDLQAIGDRARDVGAAFILDGTQSVGAMPFDFQEVRPDFFYCAGYKWCLGPYSLGFAVVGERFMDAEPIEYNWIVRKDSDDFARLVDYRDEYQPGARRFDVGERSNFILVPMLTESLRQIMEWTPEGIQQYCTKLTEGLSGMLGDSPYIITRPGETGAHLFGIRTPDPELLPGIQQELNRRGVHVSLRGTAIRVSPHVYNTAADMAALAEALIAALR
ncbi:MAG: aminotransferase class V-fold PLP-dependent enzyme, partial [bacterium]